MNTNNEKQIVKKDQSILPTSESRINTIFESLTSSLSDQEKKDLAKSIIERRIDLDFKQVEAEDKNRNYNNHIDNTIRHIQEVEKTTQSDYSYNTSTQNANGKTIIEFKRDNVTIKRDNNIKIIVIIIAVVTLALLFLS
jgi:hypothetical protein